MIGVLIATVGIVAHPHASAATRMTIGDAWSLAEANHPRVVEARQRLASLQRDVLQREAAYSPNVTVSGSGLTLRVSPDGSVSDLSPGASVSADVKLPSGLSIDTSVSARTQRSSASPLTGSVTITYPLLRSAALDSDALAVRQAETSLGAAQRQFEQLRDEVRAEVLTALHAEQLAAVRLRVAQEDYAEAQQAWVAALERFEAGIIGETERIGAQLELLRAQQEHIVASRTWEARQQQLADVLGLMDVGTYEFEWVLHWTALPAAGAVDDAIIRAVDQSVTVWERLQAEEMARLQLQEERNRPRLSAGLNGGYTNTLSEPGDSSRNAGWHVGLSVSYPLADGGQRRMTLESREEAFIRAQENREAAEQDVRAQVQELYHELEDALRSVEIAELELVRAQLELAAVRRQVELPVATASEQTVQQSERAMTRAELNRSEAVQRYQARWVALQRLQGDVPWHELLLPASGTPGDGALTTHAFAMGGEETR